jgi:HD superfamily phosphohydrolase
VLIPALGRMALVMNEHDKTLAETLAAQFQTANPTVTALTPLNAGGSGLVFRMECADGTLRALKVLRPTLINDKTLREGFEEEGNLLARIRHPRIVQCFTSGVFETDTSSQPLPYYVMEFFPHDSLDKVLTDDRLVNASMSTVASMLRQTLEALQYIHSLTPAVVHLDVKEANLLVDITQPQSPTIKLSDFGVAKIVSKDPAMTEVRGTLTYWPREWQDRLKNKLPSNVNRAAIRLPRSEVPPDVDLHMLSVTFQRVLESLFKGQQDSYWHRALSVLLERLNWDTDVRTDRSEKCRTSEAVLEHLSTLERVPSLPQPLEERRGLRVPVNPLHSYGEAIQRIVDTPWFQRLRGVRQLGVAHLVYPGATHSRFEHSLGAYSSALMYLKALCENHNSPWFALSFGPKEIRSLAFAALVHDLGHYPFAHQLEDLEGTDQWQKHEQISRDILDGSITERVPALKAAFGDPKDLLVIAERHWGIEPTLALRMFSYCFRNDVEAEADVPRSWRAAAQIINGPIDADKVDYLRRDSHHCGVTYGLLSDPGRFLSSLTIAFDGNGTTLAVTEKGRVDAELIPVVRYVMFSEVYWHHTVRSFTTMLRRALLLASQWPRHPLTLENLMLWSDDRVLFEVRQEAETCGDHATLELCKLIMSRRPYVRLFTLVKRGNSALYDALTNTRSSMMTGADWKQCKALVEKHFGIRDPEPHHVLWDIPKPGKDKLGDVHIADLHGEVIAENPGHLWDSLAENFEHWVRKIRLFVHPDCRAQRLGRADERARAERFSKDLAKQLKI